MKILNLLSFTVCLVVIGISPSSSLAKPLDLSPQKAEPLDLFPKKIQKSAQCKTWKLFVANLPDQGGRGGQWWHHGDLPPKFQNGCMELRDNNSTDTAYVFQQGIQAKDYKNWDQLVQQGKAIVVTWLTPTNGAIPYLKSIPKNRAFLRKDGMTCFSTVCLKSGTISHEQLGKILTDRKQLQQLPDGTYLYAEDPQGFHRGTNAFKFRKKGNLISGEYFASMEPSDCFVARVSGQSIESGMWLDVTFADTEKLGKPRSPSFLNKPIDFSGYSKQYSGQISGSQSPVLEEAGVVGMGFNQSWVKV